MSCKEVTWKTLKNNFQNLSNSGSYPDLLKAFVSFETGVEDEKILNDTFDFYINSKIVNNVLDDEIIEYVENHELFNNKKQTTREKTR